MQESTMFRPLLALGLAALLASCVTAPPAAPRVVSVAEWGGTPADPALVKTHTITHITLHHMGETYAHAVAVAAVEMPPFGVDADKAGAEHGAAQQPAVVHLLFAEAPRQETFFQRGCDSSVMSSKPVPMSSSRPAGRGW
jgi:hypothetical protein